MITRKPTKQTVVLIGLLIAFGALGASQARAEPQRSRASASVGSQSRGGSGRTAVHRGAGERSRGAAVTRSGRSQSRNASRGHRGHRGRRSFRGHRSHYRIGFGYYGGYYGSYYGGYYYHPFYNHYPIYYSYQPRRYDDFGGLDLSIRPKKTEVWVDGEYVGTAGRFDGYPGHLWLEDGRHELIFYKDGYETVRREVNVLEGVLLDLSYEMRPGEAVPAEELTAFDQDELLERRDARRSPERLVPDREQDRRSDRLDVREEPGRLTIEIDPSDASIYLDGRFLGTGGELARLHSGLMVEPGEHTLEVVRPGFASEEIGFSVASGEETSLSVALTGS